MIKTIKLRLRNLDNRYNDFETFVKYKNRFESYIMSDRM